MMNADQDEILDRIRELLTSDETHDTCRAELAVVTTLHSDTLREWEALRVENEAMRARLASVAAERASIRAQLAALRDQIERGGCVFTRLGETAYLCDATKACGLCRLRNARDAWENQSKREEMRADIAQLSPPLTWSSVTPSEPKWY